VDAYKALLAAAVAGEFTEGLTADAWAFLELTEEDFKWRDVDSNGLLEEWEFIVTLFEVSEFELLMGDSSGTVAFADYQTAYPTISDDWMVLYDLNEDAVIDIDEWKAAMCDWHKFMAVSVWNEDAEEYQSILPAEYMAALLEVSLDVYNTWFVQLTFDDLDLGLGEDEDFVMVEELTVSDDDSEDDEDAWVFEKTQLTWNQYIEGAVKMVNVKTAFETYTMVVDSDPQGFDFDSSSMAENEFGYYDWNGDDMVTLDEYIYGLVQIEIFEEVLQHYYLQSVEVDTAEAYYGLAMAYADADDSGFITTNEFMTA
jgi:hypothetical protein